MLRDRPFLHSWPPGLRAAVAAWAAWRLPLFVILTLFHGRLPFGPGVRCPDGLSLAVAGPLEAWHRWDSLWYLGIVKQGYWYVPGRQSTVNFFPLYPLLAGALNRAGIPLLAATLLVSQVSLLLALWGLWELAARLVPEEGAPRRALIALLCFPTAIFLSAAYAESTYLALVVWGFVFFERRRALPAALCAAFAVLTRANGVAFAAALGLGAVTRRSWREAAVFALLPALVLVNWSGWQAVHLGDPLAFLHVRAAWVGSAPPLVRTARFVAHTLSGRIANRFECSMDVAACALLLAAAVPAWRRFGPAYGGLLAGLVLLGLLGGHPWGTSRFALGAAPLFLLLGAWTSRDALGPLLLGPSLTVLVFEGLKFTHGWWAG